MTPPIKPETIPADLTPQELQAFKKRYIETADRSYMNDRLNVELPNHLYGEWVGTDSFSQFHARSKGFVDGSQFLKENNILHQTSEGNVFADIKFMVISKQKHEAMVEMDALIARKKSGIGRDRDDEYNALAASLGLGVEADKSTSRVLVGDQVNSTIKR